MLLPTFTRGESRAYEYQKAEMVGQVLLAIFPVYHQHRAVQCGSVAVVQATLQATHKG